MSNYNDLLQLLKKHVTFFQDLTVTEQNKMDAARTHDIGVLEECMKKEQADTLLLRGYDKRRLQLLEDLSLTGLTFSQIIPKVPEEYRYDFSQTYNELEIAYTNYKKISESAKEALEVHLYKINRALDSLKQKTNSTTGDLYSQNGSIPADPLTFKDMKI